MKNAASRAALPSALARPAAAPARGPASSRAVRLATLVAAAGLLSAASGAQVRSQDALFQGRPGLAEAERPPGELATCATLQASLAGFQPPRRRVDLWVTGPLTLVQTDGALWYLAVCSSPGVRVMCVTYSDNGMKVGEQVTLRGGFRPQDERHVLLDPCLASRT